MYRAGCQPAVALEPPGRTFLKVNRVFLGATAREEESPRSGVRVRYLLRSAFGEFYPPFVGSFQSLVEPIVGDTREKRSERYELGRRFSGNYLLKNKRKKKTIGGCFLAFIYF